MLLCQTLVIILPALLDVRLDKKHAKLVQYAECVWNINSGSEEEKVEIAIKKTKEFFESLGVKTHLSAHGMTALSET
ncbi:Alcohol dehydrogenase YqhD [Clostridium felsineum DSM 794]|nr:Alcohol dehydrogenase YqhD [Clostridium felsineum DSM 794]